MIWSTVFSAGIMYRIYYITKIRVFKIDVPILITAYDLSSLHHCQEWLMARHGSTHSRYAMSAILSGEAHVQSCTAFMDSKVGSAQKHLRSCMSDACAEE